MRTAFGFRLAFAPALLAAALLVACGGEAGRDSGGGPQSDPGSNGGDGATADSGRKIVRNATVELAIDDLDDALSGVRAIALDAGGFVSESHVVVQDADDPQAARPEKALVTIRVPVSEYDRAMDRLRGIAAGVDAEDTTVTEVTGEYTDLESRVRNLRAAEASYLALLERAQSIDEILTVQEKVDGVRAEIEQAQGRLNVLNDQSELASITVDLRLVTAPGPSTHWAVRAWQASWDASAALLVLFGTMAIALLFVGLWMLPPLVAGYFVWRRFGASIVAMARRLG